MIYSRWRADGGYDYFLSPERRGLGDDLPVPSLQPINGIGAASTDAGRPLPNGARYVGSGTIARGMIAPLDRSKLSFGEISPTIISVGWLALAAFIGWWVGRTS